MHSATLPTPSRIILEGLVESEKLQAHGMITAAEILGGFFLSLACSIATAVPLALFPAAGRALLPAISALRRAPLIAATPLAFIWLGFGFPAIMLLAGLLSYLALVPAFAEGLRSIPESVLDLKRLAHAGPVRTFLKLRLPSGLPAAFVAMKTAVPLVVGVVAVGEFVDGEKGLCYLMLAAAFKLETSFVLATFAAVMLIGLVLYGVVVAAEITLVRWPRGL